MRKLFKRFCSGCQEVFYCDNKCGDAKTLAETACYCKWCVKKHNAKSLYPTNYNCVIHRCEHTKRPHHDEPEKVEFT